VKIELQEGNHMLTVRLYGELDYHTVGKVREVIDKAIAQAVGKTLLLNLAGVPLYGQFGARFNLGEVSTLL
jgi:anti-anti-sigma factor